MNTFKYKAVSLLLGVYTLFSFTAVKAEDAAKVSDTVKNKLSIEMVTDIKYNGSGKISFKFTKEGSYKESLLNLSSVLPLKDKLTNLKQTASGEKKVETAEVKFASLKELNAIMPKDSENKNAANIFIKENSRGVFANGYSYEMNLKPDYLLSVLGVKQINQGDSITFSNVAIFPDNVSYVNTGINDNKTVKWQYTNEELKDKVTMTGKYETYNRIVLYGIAGVVLIISGFLVFLSAKKA